MFIKFFMLLLFSSTHINCYNLKFINNVNNKISYHKNYNIDYKKNYNINMKLFDDGNIIKSDIFNKIFDSMIIEDKRLGQYIVEKISSTLPSVDNIGHKVLHLNNEFINYILNNINIDYSLKKEIILNSIKISQAGDNIGSNLLELYYNIVEKLL